MDREAADARTFGDSMEVEDAVDSLGRREVTGVHIVSELIYLVVLTVCPGIVEGPNTKAHPIGSFEEVLKQVKEDRRCRAHVRIDMAVEQVH
jgi:hypothetical protein